MNKKQIKNEEKDDFEAMFLSDISLPSKKTTSSVITNFKELKLDNQLNKKDSLKADCKINELNNLNRFIDSLKEIPLLDMDHNLRKLIIDKYLNLSTSKSNEFTDTYFIFDLFYTKNSYDVRYKFNVKNQFQNFAQSFYRNKLKNCPEEVIACLDNGVLG